MRRFFLGDDFRNGFRIQRYFGRQWIRVLDSLRGVLKKKTHVFNVKVGFGSIPRGGLDYLKRAIFAAFCGIFRTPSTWT